MERSAYTSQGKAKMNWPNRMSRALAFGILLTILLAHILFVVSLVGFRLQSDGWVLHPVGVAWHSLFVLGSLVLLLHAWRGREATSWLPIIPLMLTVAVVGAIPATGLIGGARYASYDPYELHEVFVGANIALGLALMTLVLIDRRPRLLLAWSVAQGVLLLTYPPRWAQLWRWGSICESPLSLIGLVSLPVLYFLTLSSLGLRLPRRWGRIIALGVGVGVALGILIGLRHAVDLEWRGDLPQIHTEITRDLLLTLPLLPVFTGLLVPLPILARQMLREKEGDPQRRAPWVILVLAVLVATSFAARFMQPLPAGMLPAAGQVQEWRGPDHVVPDAWLPTTSWTGWALQAARWLLVPYVLLSVGRTLLETDKGLREAAGRIRRFFDFPQALIGAGLLWVAVLAWDFSRLALPMQMAAGEPPRIVGYHPAILPSLLILFLAARALRRVEGAGSRWTWRWLTAGALLALLIWTGQSVWLYGRILFAPMPAWIESTRWNDLPLPRVPLAGLGLLLHLVLLGLGLFASARWVGAVLPSGRQERPRQSGLLPVVVPLLVLTLVAGLGWWLRAPRVVQTTPPDGVTGVPRDTAISIHMEERPWLVRAMGFGGVGLCVRYADTGITVRGATGASQASLRFDPETPLRPGAPVEVTVHRAGERPYTLRFTTTP